MIHVHALNLAFDRHLGSARELLDRYFVLRSFADGLVDAGARVTVYQRFSEDLALRCDGVDYLFIKERAPLPFNSALAAPRILAELGRRLAADTGRGTAALIHVNSFVFPLVARRVRRMAAGRVPVVVQHRAERPPAGFRARLFGDAFRGIDAALFTHRQLARDWIESGMIEASVVRELPECASGLTALPLTKARAATGLEGTPAVLWTGNLIGVKDPLTVLRGIGELIPAYPDLRLYIAYRNDGLLGEVRELLGGHPELGARVRLLGSIPYASIDGYYSAADLFVQGSHREGSGVALIDAMICGAVPVVTDIPAFRKLTGDGRYGELFPPGDVAGFIRAFHRAMASGPRSRRAGIRDHARRNLSPAAVGRALYDTYAGLLARSGPRPAGEAR